MSHVDTDMDMGMGVGMGMGSMEQTVHSSQPARISATHAASCFCGFLYS